MLHSQQAKSCWGTDSFILYNVHCTLHTMHMPHNLHVFWSNVRRIILNFMKTKTGALLLKCTAREIVCRWRCFMSVAL